MILVRAWRRQLLGGLGVAAVVPATLLAALAVLALAGGFAGLGALGQAFSGPSVSAGQAAAGPGAHPARPISTVVLAALTSPVPSALGTASSQAGNGRGSAGGPRSPAAPPRRGGGGVPPPSRQPTASAQPPAPSPAPSPHGTLTDQLVGIGTSATSQLPAPAGPVATDTLKSAGTTVDQVFPVPAPGPPQLP